MNLQALVAHPIVSKARTLIQDRDPETVKEQIRLASIPAPTGLETERGQYVLERFRELGLNDLSTDEVGNILGWLPGRGGATNSGAPVLVTAHLDTIFPDGTEIRPRTRGSRVFAPGITDNARGLAAMLTLVSALREVEMRTRKPVLFIATVGEEGVGDLRGVKHLFRDDSPFRSAAAFISIDGAGVTRIVHRAIGACRFRATIHGLGGHSWGDRGMANPAHALGAAIACLSRIRPTEDPGFAVTVGRIGGGTSVNAIPAESWLELDLRSEDPPTLARLEREARAILEEAVQGEIQASPRQAPLVLKLEQIGSRPCGTTPPNAPLVQAAVEATKLLGGVPELTASSTDANVPIAFGVPAVAIGAGGRGGGVHTTHEWFENHRGARGIERALLTVLAVAGVHGVKGSG
jgi:tripeptide aminopeptidase